MLKLAGLAVVLGSVLGGYMLSHGQLLALWQPYELLIILGAAIGAFLISNPGVVVKDTLGALGRNLKGKHYGKDMYMDLLSLLYEIFNKARKNGLMAIEEDVETPESSEIFNRFPRVTMEHHLMDFICDYLRIMAAGNLSAIELESLMDQEIETALHESMAASHAVSKISDGLPGFGIVAAVMGIVITMGALGGPPEVLGHHVAAALVGTFLGILLAYGFIGPLAVSLEHMATEDIKALACAKTAILAMVNGIPPQLAVEFGRKAIGSHERPTFKELDDHLRGR
ncbi:MAG TPA: flagellar motor stator protein MotA [Dongiaceae bacterium]|nr:flagellar motor stator protein MotA [Dongiaceae bacterium]